MGQYTLYGRRGSGSFAVQVALEEIGVDYSRVWIDNEPGAVARYREVNPTGKVPALSLPDGTLMFESAAILVHLALAHPEAGLAPPPGTVAHALFLQWMTYMAANVYEAALRVYYSERYSTRGAQDAPAIREQGSRDLLAHLDFVSRSLDPHVLGARESIADVYLYMLASWYPGGTGELYTCLPPLGVHGRRVSARPAVSKVEAEHAG